jgi:hypothetical protein
MKKSTLIVFPLVVVLLWVTGCATTSSVVNAKEDGTSQVYQVNPNQAWEVAKTVFRWEGTDDIEEHRPEGYMIARNGKEWVPWGALMVAWVDQVDRKNTKVTVVTKRNLGREVATTSSEAAFHERFAEAVKIMKAGKPLPSEAPKSK